MTIQTSTVHINILSKFGIGIQANAPLSKYTTFCLGGPCAYLLTCETPLQLEETISCLLHDNQEFILIGGGSNIVVSDQGINCVVIRYLSKRPLIIRENNELLVSGSTLLDNLAQYAAQNGLEGLNCTSGIPGTVGGAIVGNAGAFGKQVGDCLTAAYLITLKGIKKQVTNEALEFSYRNSILRKTGDVVQLAKFHLNPADKDALLGERKKILTQRAEKHPNLETDPCAGSFFRNVEPTSKAGKRQAAGWFLDQAGGKHLSEGGAKIFPKHANIIIKSENCTAQDVFKLSQRMAQLVKNHYNLNLIREVKFVGKFDGQEPDRQMIW